VGTDLQNVFVLDIEGTTTPISFVTEVLFPYAKENVGSFLRSTYNSTETLNDIQLLRDQVSGTSHHTFMDMFVCQK
jgi:methionine salvage enolase-phosphatase E1